jgi:hypothetical protein
MIPISNCHSEERFILVDFWQTYYLGMATHLPRRWRDRRSRFFAVRLVCQPSLEMPRSENKPLRAEEASYCHD